jgi:hypothetical protein
MGFEDEVEQSLPRSALEKRAIRVGVTAADPARQGVNKLQRGISDQPYRLVETHCVLGRYTVTDGTASHDGQAGDRGARG